MFFSRGGVTDTQVFEQDYSDAFDQDRARIVSEDEFSEGWQISQQHPAGKESKWSKASGAIFAWYLLALVIADP